MKTQRVASALIFRRGHFLAVQEARGRHRGLWGLPGGHLDRGESPLNAARREAREETGLRLHGMRLLEVSSFYNIRFFLFRARARGALHLSPEIAAARWLAPAAIARYRWRPGIPQRYLKFVRPSSAAPATATRPRTTA